MTVAAGRVEYHEGTEESMSPVHRSLAGDILAFDLGQEMRVIREELRGGRARIARTLIKEGSLRATLVGLAAGGALDEHDAAGAVTIHVVDGEVELTAGGETQAYPTGSLIAIGRRVRHAVRSEKGAMFLLTLSTPAADAEPR
jgi:quercetin dioxygenase-like cupin family protein